MGTRGFKSNTVIPRLERRRTIRLTRFSLLVFIEVVRYEDSRTNEGERSVVYYFSFLIFVYRRIQSKDSFELSCKMKTTTHFGNFLNPILLEVSKPGLEKLIAFKYTHFLCINIRLIEKK